MEGVNFIIAAGRIVSWAWSEEVNNSNSIHLEQNNKFRPRRFVKIPDTIILELN
jgi:hypothetical protein